MTTVYFLRHGQSIGNLTHHYLGHTDGDLSELGYKQAELSSHFFELIDIDVIYSSDLKRAYNTVKPTADKKGLPIITSDRLREIFAGEWENKSIDYLWENYYETFFVWKNDTGNAVSPGGESVKELFKRVNEEVNSIVAENKDKKILIATHATPIRVLTALWRGLPIEETKNIPWVSNASVTCVEYRDDGKYFIRTNGFDEYLGNNKSGLPKGI